MRVRGDVEEAVARLSDAHTHGRALHEAAPSSVARRNLAAIVYELGVALNARGDFEESCTHLRRALDYAQVEDDRRLTTVVQQRLDAWCNEQRWPLDIVGLPLGAQCIWVRRRIRKDSGALIGVETTAGRRYSLFGDVPACHPLPVADVARGERAYQLSQ